MTADQITILAILGCAMALFLWGRWRHDVVALAALLAAVAAGLVPGAVAFAGFGHPAVITVACVLVLSRGLQTSGAVDILARRVLPSAAGPTLSVAALVALGATLSGGMNNVGAMALLMPVAVQLAGRLDLAPGQVLMPLSFGTILGGMTTLIGTPPNLIVSGFRANLPPGNETLPPGAFGLFDFTPVGLSVAVAGVAFVGLVGWRLVPVRRTAASDGFETGTYMAEAQVTEGGKAAGMTLRALERALRDADAQVLGLVRNRVRLTAPHGGRRIRENDILVLEADLTRLPEVLTGLGLRLRKDDEDAEEDAARTGTVPAAEGEGGGTDDGDGPPGADEIALVELVVRADSSLIGRSAEDLRLRTRFGVNLIAVSRHGRPSRARLRQMKIAAGDLLLIQGPPDSLTEFAAETGAIPLAERDLHLPPPRQAALAAAILFGAAALAATGAVPAAVAFAAGVVVSMVAGTVPPRRVYDAIDWPVIVLLAALLPVAEAMQTTGTADLIALALLDGVAQGQPVLALALVLVVTMALSDLMNNAATAAVICPIAIGAAAALGANPDTFLMAVAIGASCAFLTPVGHQNNTLILGPGGFRFGDFLRLGLLLEIVVVAVSLPVLLLVWPL